MPATILIVDDARLNREVLKLALAPEGYRIIEAEDGQQAIDQLQANDVDLVLLDLMMPVMDGFAFLQWRNESARYKSIPVIVNSALDDFDSIQRSLDLDSYDYFTKPLTEQDLKVILPLKIRNAVQSKRLYYQLKDSNERLRKEIEMAGRYQRFLLPDNPDLPGLKVATFYQPYIGVAGDFFDVVELGDAHAFIIADVSGHGLLSAIVSSLLKPLFQQYIAQTRSPAETFRMLNRDLNQLTRDEDYVTAFCGVFDPAEGRLTYASAGHPPQFFMHREGNRIEELKTFGFFLGVFDNDNEIFEQNETSLEVNPGDRLMIFTDGVTEAFNVAREPFGFDRCRNLFSETRKEEPEQVSSRLWKALLEHTGANLEDDVAFMVVQFGGEDA